MGVRKRGRAGAISVLPSPSQETNPDPCPLPPWNSPWHQKAPTPFLTRHLGSLFKVEGGERRKARAASGIPKHSLMKRLWHGGGRAALDWQGYPCGLGSAAAATHTVVMEQLISILFIILIVLNHGH